MKTFATWDHVQGLTVIGANGQNVLNLVSRPCLKPLKDTVQEIAFQKIKTYAHLEDQKSKPVKILNFVALMVS